MTTQKPVSQRGRPKGASNDNRSFGPLGDLIRRHRFQKKLGLSDVAHACDCSVQFISNIEHGRAPLPWDKAQMIAEFLEIDLGELQAANLSMRADFQVFLTGSKPSVMATQLQAQGKRVMMPKVLQKEIPNQSTVLALTALASHDTDLQELLEKYQLTPLAQKKKFIKSALKLFEAL